ncbi:MAG TPA: glycosyltransferase family 2 protein [Candidatus Acetothermia bacterium]|nr:glycosyltransferase family 2 protein [Candidatus Acetothermia bacterium]
MNRVSVVVPARNEEDLLPRCLFALRQQTHENFEIIVVDSASTDNTQQVARSFGARVIRLEEPGVGRARQAGFDGATGDIIVSTDADAICKPDWLQRIVAPFADQAVVGTFGTIKLTGQPIWTRLGHALFSGFQAANLRVGHPLFCGPNFAVRKNAFRDVDGFRVEGEYPDEAEDVRLAQKLKKRGKILFLPHNKVIVSSRRLDKGQGLRYTGHHAGVYLKVCWLGSVKRGKSRQLRLDQRPR